MQYRADISLLYVIIRINPPKFRIEMVSSFDFGTSRNEKEKRLPDYSSSMFQVQLSRFFVVYFKSPFLSI